MKKVFCVLTFLIGLITCVLMFNSCNSSSKKQQVEIVSSYGEWEDWSKVNVYLLRKDGWDRCGGGLKKVQRRIVDGEKEYRIYFSDEWYPVTKESNTFGNTTMHYRFVALGSVYYFDM